MTRAIYTCRLCNEFGHVDELVQYGVRHSAHFRCYLDAGKPLGALKTWQVGEFPYRLLQERGLLQEAQSILRPCHQTTRG